MSLELWERRKPLFHASLKKGAQDRSALIDAACERDLELRKHLEQILEAERQGTETLDASLAGLNGFFDNAGPRFQPGELVLGRFRIVRPIGKAEWERFMKRKTCNLG